MPRTSHVTHIKSRKPSAKAESFLFSCGIIYVNLMVSSRGIPSRNTVYGSSPPLNFRSPSSVFCRYSFYCINHFFNSCICLSLTPVRVIFLKVNRSHIATATVPNIKTEALCILISCTHHFSTINVRLAGRSGNYNLNVFPIRPVAGTTACGAGVSGVVICLLL